MNSEDDSGWRTVSVLHLITRFRDGGAERVTVDTIDALREADRPYKITLGVGADSIPERVEAVWESGIPTVTFRLLRHYNPLCLLLAVLSIALYLRRHRFDVIHTHSTEAGIVGRLAGALAGTPVIVHDIHGDPVSPDRHRLLNRALVAAEMVSASVTSALVVGSIRIKDTFLERGIGTADQYHVIYDGIDIDRFKRQAPADDIVKPTAESWNDETCHFLFVGRLVDGKGLFDLLYAIAGLPPDVVDGIKLHVVGDGPLWEELQRRSEALGTNERVLFHGYREDMPSVMAAVDVLVLPSYREGTPRVITEARAAGLAVVATDIAGIPEMVDDGRTGYLIQPGDIEALRDRIAEVATDPERCRRMGDAGREGLDQFSKETAGVAYRELYAELLADAEG